MPASSKRKAAAVGSTKDAIKKRKRVSKKPSPLVMKKVAREKNQVPTDPGIVLKKVVELGKHLRVKKKSGKKLTLAELKLPNVCKEVDIMDCSELQAHIQKIVISVVNDILEGKGFSYTMPTRSSGNQLYVPELDRIVLKDKMLTREFA
eukprot:1324092-Amorphochlora_amoeboformis.AAC.1